MCRAAPDTDLAGLPYWPVIPDNPIYVSLSMLLLYKKMISGSNEDLKVKCI